MLVQVAKELVKCAVKEAAITKKQAAGGTVRVLNVVQLPVN